MSTASLSRTMPWSAAQSNPHFADYSNPIQQADHQYCVPSLLTPALSDSTSLSHRDQIKQFMSAQFAAIRAMAPPSDTPTVPQLSLAQQQQPQPQQPFSALVEHALMSFHRTTTEMPASWSGTTVASTLPCSSCPSRIISNDPHLAVPRTGAPPCLGQTRSASNSSFLTTSSDGLSHLPHTSSSPHLLFVGAQGGAPSHHGVPPINMGPASKPPVLAVAVQKPNQTTMGLPFSDPSIICNGGTVSTSSNLSLATAAPATNANVFLLDPNPNHTPGGNEEVSEKLDAPPCDHVASWKRLRAKKGYGHFLCKFCGAKWRKPKAALLHTSMPVPSEFDE